MKVYWMMLIGLGLSLAVPAQNNLGKADDAGRIILHAFIPDQTDQLPAAARSQLENKLNQIVTKAGLGGNAIDDRFLITAHVQLLTKDITSSSPPMHAYTLELTFYIGDGIDGTLFSSTSLTQKGVGETEAKAYIAALKNVQVSDPRYQAFIETGKNKIIEYYNSRCDFILKEADALADQREFDAAIAKLVAVPEVTKACYEKAMDKAVLIHQRKLELECQQNIASANAAIAQDKWEEAAGYLSDVTPDLKCYNQAAATLKKIEDHQCAVHLGKARGAWASRNVKETAGHLGNISSDSKCAAEARALSREITSMLDERAKKEWELAYEKYDRNQQMKEKRQDADIASEKRQQDYQAKQGFQLEKARIDAAKAVGVAYGKNQPKRVTYNIRGWW